MTHAAAAPRCIASACKFRGIKVLNDCISLLLLKTGYIVPEQILHNTAAKVTYAGNNASFVPSRFIMCHEDHFPDFRSLLPSSSLLARSFFLSPGGVKKKRGGIAIKISPFVMSRAALALVDYGERHVAAAVVRHAGANGVAKMSAPSKFAIILFNSLQEL